ncbi:hypothetical protein EHQ96_00010 [Leptospira levettii]|uniref:hypothetical protein n=1 Tax=Leptospira levettii TaxID=2023178 RepID=UPI0010840C2C|nr:hypothetical protein [Leptospira levettii]TGM73625.1 hypothetical protein EHQ96_00010 [Leptospira levettii]
MKKLTTVILLLISSQLLAEEINQGQVKNNRSLSIYLRRYSTFIDSFEQRMLFQNFNYFDQNDKKTIPGYEFGIRKKFENSNFSFQSEFQEYKKGNIGMRATACIGRYCDLAPVSAGAYLRNQFRNTILYDTTPDKFRLSFGLRYIKSELSDGSGYRYNYTLGQKFFGPEIGFEYQTDKYWNFNLLIHYNYFYLFGKIDNRYNGIYINFSPVSYNSDPNATYVGGEFGMKLNYDFDELYYLSIGILTLEARTKVNPYAMTVNYAADPQYKYALDTGANINYLIYNAANSREVFRSVYLEAGLKL